MNGNVLHARSFAIVIQQLPAQLRDAVCVFYLVLRALDTVEDDMAVAQEIKIPLLRAFHEKCYDRCGHPLACQRFCFVQLLRSFRDNATMGAGWARFATPTMLQAAGDSERCLDAHGLCFHTSWSGSAFMPAR